MQLFGKSGFEVCNVEIKYGIVYYIVEYMKLWKNGRGRNNSAF